MSTPSTRQDYLLRQLQKGHNENLELEVPSSTLPTQEILGLSTPSQHQSNLLRQLKANQNGIQEGLSLPSKKQNPFLRQLKKKLQESNRNENLEFKIPTSGRQNPLLNRQNLQRGHNERIKGLSVPSNKQNPLLRNLQGGHTRENDQLDLPINPLNQQQSIRPAGRFNPDGLNLPRRRQNPLLRILRFDKRERILSKGLTPPRYKQNPLFRQLVQTPQRYQNDFLQLPPKQQHKLMAILKRHGGDNFNAHALLGLPNEPEPEELEVVVLPTLQEEPEELEVFELPLINNEEQFETEEEVEYYDDEEEVEQDYEANDYSTTIRHRPVMPKSKFEIFQNRQPVEEVTFQRVNEPLTLKDKKEGKTSR